MSPEAPIRQGTFAEGQQAKRDLKDMLIKAGLYPVPIESLGLGIPDNKISPICIRLYFSRRHLPEELAIARGLMPDVEMEIAVEGPIRKLPA